MLSAGNSSQTLTIYYGDDDYVVIDDYLTGHLGIVLEEFQEPEVPVASLATIAGDLAPIDVDPNTAGVQYEYDSIGNVVVNLNIVELDREDFLNDSVNDDVIYGHGGDDYIGMSRGGNDYLDGGRGEDKIFGGSGIDTVIGGEGVISHLRMPVTIFFMETKSKVQPMRALLNIQQDFEATG